MAKAEDVRDLLEISKKILASEIDCHHTFKIIKGSGQINGIPLWKCTKCPKVVQSS